MSTPCTIPQPAGLGDPCVRTLYLTEREVKTLRRALKRHRREVARDFRNNQREGWTPAPGHADLAALSLKTIDSLLGRIPHPGFETTQPEGGQ